MPVVGTTIKTYSEQDIRAQFQRDLRLVPELAKHADIILAGRRHEMFGKSFVFEELACGDLGDCLGIIGHHLKQPSKRRICIVHSYPEDEE